MSQQNHYVYEFGPFHLDATRRALLKEGEPLKLFPKEFDTLLALVERSGELLEKEDLMRTVWHDAPFLGKGYRYVALTAGQSTHNQLVEILASFGLAGLAAIGLASYLLYWGGSARFLLVCVAPTFLFSHNFFETVSFQTALGLALAVDRSRDTATPVDESG